MNKASFYTAHWQGYSFTVFTDDMLSAISAADVYFAALAADSCNTTYNLNDVVLKDSQGHNIQNNGTYTPTGAY